MSRYAEEQAARKAQGKSGATAAYVPVVDRFRRKTYSYDENGKRVGRSRQRGKRDFRNPDPFVAEDASPRVVTNAEVDPTSRVVTNRPPDPNPRVVSNVEADASPRVVTNRGKKPDFIEVHQIDVVDEPEENDYEVVEEVLKAGADGEAMSSDDYEEALREELRLAREQRERAEALLKKQTERLIGLLTAEDSGGEAQSGLAQEDSEDAARSGILQEDSEGTVRSSGSSKAGGSNAAGGAGKKSSNKGGEKLNPHNLTKDEVKLLTPSVELIMSLVEKAPPSLQNEILTSARKFVQACQKARISPDCQKSLIEEYNSVEQRRATFHKKSKERNKAEENFSRVLGL